MHTPKACAVCGRGWRQALPSRTGLRTERVGGGRSKNIVLADWLSGLTLDAAERLGVVIAAVGLHAEHVAARQLYADPAAEWHSAIYDNMPMAGITAATHLAASPMSSQQVMRQGGHFPFTAERTPRAYARSPRSSA